MVMVMVTAGRGPNHDNLELMILLQPSRSQLKRGPIQLLALLVSACLLLPQACRRDVPSGNRTTLVFKHGKIAGDPAPFREVLAQFEKENPGIRIQEEILPSATDEQHQFYVINLEGKSGDFDVLAMDVIWVPEFARAGWLQDITHLLPPQSREAFFSGPLEAVTQAGRVYAVPWYIDAGVLYYRKDLLDKYGFTPPKHWQELVHSASVITASEPGLYGFLWQGKQYEGLICDVLEYLWSHGGDVLQENRVVIDSAENRRALSFMRDLIDTYGVTPAFVTTATEEPTRHIFGKGGAVFMRNWPYAWNLFQRDGSAVKGKVGLSALPAAPGHRSASTLGGWQLGINRYGRHPREAERFILYMTSYETQKRLSLTIGYKPTRKALYRDEALLAAQPFMADLYEVFERARPRPVTPYYMMLSQVLQPEFSAVLAGIKEPVEALRSARRQMEFILKIEGQGWARPGRR